ncbi:MAG: helix-turn-helix transcriptional regulator [Sphaerochaeta sp.]|nr:helix-turn-helix transcriptional regulator [Sphaerochaeta sp.]
MRQPLQTRGTYQAKLQRTFTAIAIAIILILGGFFSFVMIQTNTTTYRTALRTTMQAKSDAARAAMGIIENTFNILHNEEHVRRWIESDSDEEYFFYARKVYEDLGKATTNLSGLEYDIGITSDEEGSFVITRDGTVRKEDFFSQKGSGIGLEGWKEFLLSPKQEMFLPMYADATLRSLYLLKKYAFGKRNLCYLIHIPMKTLLGGEEFSFIYGNNFFFPMQQGEENEEKLSFLLAHPTSGSLTEHIYKGKPIFVLHPSAQAWFIALEYTVAPIRALHAILVFFLPLMAVSVALLLLSLHWASRLYSPIRRTLIRVPNLKKDGSTIDEFKLLEENLNTLQQLNQKLAQAIEETNNLTVQRYYRELIFGVPTSTACPLKPAQMHAKYLVALIEMHAINEDFEKNDWFLQLQKNHIHLYIQTLQSVYNLYYVNISYSSFAIILQSDSEKEAKELLGGLSTLKELAVHLSIFLSACRAGISSIAISYKETLLIAEYKYATKENLFITSSDIPKDKGNSFFYPLSLENKFVQAIVAGQEEALAIFDTIIEENFQMTTLSNEAHRNLMYSLIGTLLRVMQELKITAMELLGKNFDFPWLYENWASEKMVERLRKNFSLIRVAIHERKKSTDDILLKTMQDYIFANYDDDIMLNDIADHCNISAKYCSTLFKKLSNENFKTFLNEYRIERACEMIKNNPLIKVVDLSRSVGFNSSSSFIRVFKTKTNMTPKAYAEMVRS